MSRISCELFSRRVYDKTAGGFNLTDYQFLDPVDDDNMTFQDVADSGCPKTKAFLKEHPEMSGELYNRTLNIMHSISDGGATGLWGGAGTGLALGGAVGGPVGAGIGTLAGAVGGYPAGAYAGYRAAAGGGSFSPLMTLGGGALGAAAGGLLGNYLGTKYDTLNPQAATLLGAGLGGIGGMAGGYLLNRYLDS